MRSDQLNEYHDILEFFDEFSNPDPACDGIERLLSVNGIPEVLKRFQRKPLQLNKVQLNQLLVMSGLPSVSFGFFKYYWLSLPRENHPYDIEELDGHLQDFSATFFLQINDDEFIELRLIDQSLANWPKNIYKSKEGTYFERDPRGNYSVLLPSYDTSFYEYIVNTTIHSLEQFRWGLRRLFVDSLLYFGNITLGFTTLGKKRKDAIYEFFDRKRFDTELIRDRGHSLDFVDIPEEDRYLISEMACQTLSPTADGISPLESLLSKRFGEARTVGIERIKIGTLLEKGRKITRRDEAKIAKTGQKRKPPKLDAAIEISTADIFDEVVGSWRDIARLLKTLQHRFNVARLNALQNTRLYLSLIDDMDVYVATSMRSKADFLSMARNCKAVFHDFPNAESLNLRYFDPTMSAANGHEDKGIIECLMVKCAKALIYTSGDKDSYGKDAEAAMALSSGKPVIFLCDIETREHFFRDVHPLSKLIDFKTGVANGAMVTSDNRQVADLLYRIFTNKMQYRFERELSIDPEGLHSRAYYRIVEKLTDSTVRLQTSDLVLSRSFWNYFTHNVNR